MQLMKRIAAKLPGRMQAELKRLHFARQIRRGDFSTDEREYALLERFVKPGDWVLDIGANVGHYTLRMSELVGSEGRVIAFEPVPETFTLLTANTQLFRHQNVTLINVAVSDKVDVVGMSMPMHATGLKNYYEAHISSAAGTSLKVITLSPDTLFTGCHISLAKIDAEGHEGQVLAGMRGILQSSRPVLIVETWSDEIVTAIEDLGYRCERLDGSSNVLFHPIR